MTRLVKVRTSTGTILVESAVSENTGILIETTKYQPSKDKVDQVTARKQEHAVHLSGLLGLNPNIHLLIVTTNVKAVIDRDARLDAVTNEVAVLTAVHILELVSLLKEGKLNRWKVIQGNPGYEPSIVKATNENLITWINADVAPHTVTSGTGGEDEKSGALFDSGSLGQGQKFSMPASHLGATGNYDYYCIVHPFMKGMVSIQ